MEMDRRHFVKCAACGLLGLSVLPGLSLAEESGTVDAGTINDYPQDGVYDGLAFSDKVLIVRGGGKIYAMSATCTHRNNTVMLHEGKIVCPGHGARFANDGKVTKGPAEQPLPRLAISLNDKGRLIVDRARQFAEGKWGDKGSFVEIPKAPGA